MPAYDLTETFDASLGFRRQLQQDVELAALVVTSGRALQNLTVILDGHGPAASVAIALPRRGSPG
jgi:hypothetical protein